MKKYLVSFEHSNETNNQLHVQLRSKLENLSHNSWIQLFPNSVVIKINVKSIDDLYSELLPEAEQLRLFIAEFVDIKTNEPRAHLMLDKYDY